MALTISNLQYLDNGGNLARVFDLTYDDSYPTGGESLDVGSLALSRVGFFSANSTGGYVFRYDHSADKIQAYRAGNTNAVLAEASNTTDLSAITVRVKVEGV